MNKQKGKRMKTAYVLLDWSGVSIQHGVFEPQIRGVYLSEKKVKIIIKEKELQMKASGSYFSSGLVYEETTLIEEEE